MSNPYLPPQEFSDHSPADLAGIQFPLEAHVPLTAEHLARGAEVHSGRNVNNANPLVRIAAGFAGLLTVSVATGAVVHLIRERQTFGRGGASMVGLFFVMGCGFLAWALFANRTLHRRRTEPHLPVANARKVSAYVVTVDQLTIKTAYGNTNWPWSRVHRWKDGRDVVLIYDGAGQYEVIPVGDFPVHVADVVRGLLRNRTTSDR